MMHTQTTQMLVAAHHADRLQFFGDHVRLADKAAFNAHLAPLRKIDWVVYAKEPFAGPKQVLRYLSRYTHRIAISNRRLLSADQSGTHFETDAVYPGAAPKEDHTPASITIANGKTQMDFAGFTYLLDGPRFEGWPPNTTMFDQADLGYARDDPELYQDKWHALENRVFDFLDSGHPLTISAKGKSYVLPLVNAPRWRARFQKIC
jgi:hypothetical protein